MTDQEPVEVTNLDRYGDPPLAWSRPRDLLVAGPPQSGTAFFLGTSWPDGRPHAAGIGALWLDGDIYFTSGPETRKARNLATNPACTISVGLDGIDLVLDREAGWPAQVEGEAFTAPFSAPSAGPPPWHLYRFRFHTAFGVATAEPYGATRWRFDR